MSRKWNIKTGLSRTEILRAEQLLDTMIAVNYRTYKTIGTVYRTNSGIQRCYQDIMKRDGEVIGICVQKSLDPSGNHCTFSCDYAVAVKSNPDMINLNIYIRLIEEKFNKI